MSAIVDIEPLHVTASGQRYRVWHDGAVLIDSCREPLCTAARALSAAGVTGRIQTRNLGSDMIRSSGLISVLATMTVTEGQTGMPHFTKWSKHWATAGA